MSRERVTRQSRMEEFITVNEGGQCNPGIVKGLKEIKSYTSDLIDALKDRFEDNLKDPFIREIKGDLDFSFMLDLKQEKKQGNETVEGCFAKV